MTVVPNSMVSAGYVMETTAGVVPATPAFKAWRIKSDALEIVNDLAFSAELNGFRGDVGGVPIYQDVKGAIGLEYSYGILDDMLTSVLRNAWAVNSITDGNTPATFTTQTDYNAGTTQIYKRASGLQVDKMMLNFKPNAVVDGTLDLMGLNGQYTNVAVAGATLVAAANEAPVATPTVGAFAFGAFTPDYVVSADLTIANNMKPRKVLGSLNPADIGAYKFDVTGSLVFFVSGSALNTMLAYTGSTPTTMSFTVGNVTGKKLNVSLPRVMITSLKTVSQSKDGDAMVECKWKAAQSSFAGGNVITITRNNV